MSKLRRIPDIERTTTMLDLIACRYGGERGMSPSHVVLEEVAPGTGFYGASRFADALVLSVWQSNGLTLDGFEIKASRADLKKELSDPTKAEALARYCDTWTLVAWDESVLVDGIPEAWGIQLTRDGEHGRELYVHRKATKREPDVWSRPFVCSLVRNAYQQAPSAALLARACTETAEIARRNAGHEAKHARSALVRPLAVALYGRDDWRWPSEARDPERLMQIAVERLTQLPLAVPA